MKMPTLSATSVLKNYRTKMWRKRRSKVAENGGMENLDSVDLNLFFADVAFKIDLI